MTLTVYGNSYTVLNSIFFFCLLNDSQAVNDSQAQIHSHTG